eukprot:TRINITY_DN40402_c0_g1_i1.p1 TRINITY_DN40402_c0_g1~~TRINITY_DN40402_c0_g1_i1.p1  ORF type:complete len:251 (+),score=47.90 TRINITY_DN40402_c0_g1_i1:573-1325(+)
MMIDNIVDERLKVNVFDRDAFTADDPLGEVLIPIDELTPGVPKEDWYHLEKVPTGEIHLTLTWIPIVNKEDNHWPEAKKVNALAHQYEKPGEGPASTAGSGAGAGQVGAGAVTRAPHPTAPTSPGSPGHSGDPSTPPRPKTYDVQARGSERRKSHANPGPHRIYTFEVQDGSEVWKINRYYHEFENLHSTLKVEVPGQALPTLPGKKWLGRKGDTYYQEKSNALRGFIRALLGNPRLREHPSVQHFISQG